MSVLGLKFFFYPIYEVCNGMVFSLRNVAELVRFYFVCNLFFQADPHET